VPSRSLRSAQTHQPPLCKGRWHRISDVGGVVKKTKIQKSQSHHARLRALLFPLSLYFFLFIYIYILHALLFRRGTELFYTTLLYFCSPPTAIFFTLQENFFRYYGSFFHIEEIIFLPQFTADWLLPSGIQARLYRGGRKH